MTSMKEQPKRKSRVIRVFISSTFSDMRAERDELVKHVFPVLRKKAEEHGVAWSEVDLRWGITDEQTAEGRVMSICLTEIEECRPFFISILGERYGWIPDQFEDRLLETYPWLVDFKGKSVTELEILHGALRDRIENGHIFFYLRDPKYIQSLANKAAKTDFVTEDQNQHAHLRDLKRRIRESPYKVHENFIDPVDLGRLVLEDMSGIIEQLYPLDEKPDPVAKEAMEHEAFVMNRAYGYVERPGIFDEIDRHVDGAGPPLVITGESGSGKSALLANWAQRYIEGHTGSVLLWHFIGASPSSTDWTAMVKRLMTEGSRRLGIPEEDALDDPSKLRGAFITWLHKAAAKGRLVILVDAVNQLEDFDRAPDLAWLPVVLPHNIRLVISALPGRSLDEAKGRDWTILEVYPLSYTERLQVIDKYLTMFGKNLLQDIKNQIAASEQSANPLYLKTLLEEIRVHGDHATLLDRIRYYLNTKSIDELFEAMLKRFEIDYDRDRMGLVRDSLKLLWGARRGISEPDLLSFLGHGGEPMPTAFWSPLHQVLRPSLIERTGLLGFSHDYMRRAVENRYLPTEEDRKKAHLVLADHFSRFEAGHYKVDELPWQLSQACAWEQLYKLLSNPWLIHEALKVNKYAVLRYWGQIERSSDLRMVKAYSQLIADPARSPDNVWPIANLLFDSGHHRQALQMFEFLSEYYEKSGITTRMPDVLNAIGIIHRGEGRLDKAMDFFERSLGISRISNDPQKVSMALNNLGELLILCGERDKALERFQEALDLTRHARDLREEARTVRNIGRVLEMSGRLEDAEGAFVKANELWLKAEDLKGKARGLLDIGRIQEARGNLDVAMGHYKSALNMMEDLNDPEGKAEAFIQIGAVNVTQGKYQDGKDVLTKALEIAKGLSDPKLTATCMKRLADIDLLQGKPDLVLKTFEGILKTYENLKDLPSSAKMNNSVGSILLKMGRPNEAIQHHETALKISRHINDKVEIVVSLTGIGSAQAQNLELQKARDTLDQALDEATIIERPWEIANLQNKCGEVLELTGVYPEALKYYQKALDLFKSLGSLNDILETEILIANVFRKMNRKEEASRQLDEASDISATLKDPVSSAKYYIARATMELDNANPKDAFLMAQGAIAGAYKANDKGLMAMGLMVMIRAYKKIGQSEKLKELLVKAKELAALSNNPTVIIEFYKVDLDDLLEKKDLLGAIEVERRLLSLFNTIGNHDGTVQTYDMFIHHMYILGEIEVAVEQSKERWAVLKKMGVDDLIVDAHSKAGELILRGRHPVDVCRALVRDGIPPPNAMEAINTVLEQYDIRPV